jgi:hypothetical protein
MEMIVMGEEVHSEGRYRKAFAYFLLMKIVSGKCSLAK